MGRNFKNKNKLTPVQIMSSVNKNSKNIVKVSIDIFDDSAIMNSNFKEY